MVFLNLGSQFFSYASQQKRSSTGRPYVQGVQRLSGLYKDAKSLDSAIPQQVVEMNPWHIELGFSI